MTAAAARGNWPTRSALLTPPTTVFEYDHMNRVVKKYMPYAVSGLSGLTDPAAAIAWEAIKIALPVGQACESFQYDDLGRQVVHVDYAGQWTLYRYYNSDPGDGDYFMAGGQFRGLPGQLKSQDAYHSDPGATPGVPAEQTVFSYDALGRKLTETVYEDGVQTYSTTYAYDDEGRVASITTLEGTVNYEYSPITGLKTATWTGTNPAAPGTRTEYAYDELGRLRETMLTWRNGVDLTLTDDQEVTAYTYSAVGSRESAGLPNGVYTAYEYNALNRLTNLWNFPQYEEHPHAPASTALSSFAYPPYANGMRAGATELVNEDRWLVYQYDGLNRLTQEKSYGITSPDPLVVGDYGYTADYTYDLAGNRTLRHVAVTRQNEGQPETVDLWTKYEFYAGTDRLHKELHSNTEPSAAIPWQGHYAYAYADTGIGGVSYGLPGSNRRIGQMGAFFVGLPSVFSRYFLYVALGLLACAACGPALLNLWRQAARKHLTGPRPTLSPYHRSLCVLLACIFLVGPESLHTLAHGAVAYADLNVDTWGSDGDAFTYTYDANGSVEYKYHGDYSTPPASPDNYDHYEYNLHGRLRKLTKHRTEGADTVKHITEYTYNLSGIRIGSCSYKTVNGGAAQDEITTAYLIDPDNHTGYAQVLEETVTDSSGTETITYTIGDDIITQASTVSGVKHLLYDGHGSTRQLADASGSVAAADNYNYDAYGMLLGGNPTTASPAATNYLYTGEQYDNNLQQYYLRARYYDPATGRFNRTDPYAGSPQDPQSLHKYLYCHANPVNATDPSGLWSLIKSITVVGILGNVTSLICNYIRAFNLDMRGDHAGAAEARAWAMLDLFFLMMPFAGPGAGLVQTTGPIVQNVICMSKAGMSASAIWGYLRMMSQAGQALDSGGGSGSSGSSGSDGPSGGEFMGNEPALPGAKWYKFKIPLVPWRQAAARYQSFVNGKPEGWDLYYNGYRFDGYGNGKLVDAKHGYENLIQRNGQFYDFMRTEFREVARSMTKAARNIPVLFRCSTPELAEAVRNALGGIPNVTVDCVPAPPGL